MAPKNKAKAAGISASSFFDLKAEVAKQQEEFAKSKAAGQSSAIVGGVKRPEKKTTVWIRQNRGVHARAARDNELEAVSKPTLESARAALERKAKIYDKLRKGKSGGLDDKQYDLLLVDFDAKLADGGYESDSDDVDESATVPSRPEDDEDDPIIEYEDEFGRLRSGRRSEIPRELMPRAADEVDEDEDILIRNPVNHFPVYEPTEERIAAVEQEYSEANNPLGVHYDATQEVRAKGAGFYRFSGDEETRRQQMEELKSARVETEKTRQETGAMDVRPGEAEGMQDDATTIKTRAMEKRKRELEDRRRAVDAKRRKVKGADVAASAVHAPDSGVSAPFSAAAPPPDPFAALERQASTSKGKGKAKETDTNDADAFLAQLERDMLASKGQ